VFYNPAMAGDRDLGVAFARALPPVEDGARTGWEMMAATGVRGLRLLHESAAFTAFTFTEANPDAFRVLAANVGRFTNARAVPGDAREAPSGAPFDYVDLDPYGTPVPFVPVALASVRPGGVLAVTATDMMVLAGPQPSACLRRYGARPVRGRLGPEGGLRILLALLARHSETLGRSIRPLLAYARDHYVRAYVEVRAGATGPTPVGVIDPSLWTGPWVGDRGPYGPLWLGPLFDADVVARLEVHGGAAQPAELARFLERLKDEVAVDRPFYYEANVLAARLHLAEPPSLRSVSDGLRALGYHVARTHARPEAFRTDAPRTEVEQLVRRLANPA
jgi:tRNA (guanine26-N2/guanine27-N2)-dimethyltransferase